MTLHTGTPKSGFSLVELLVVMVISTMLAAFAIPAVSSLQGSTNINGCSDTLGGVLENARATAMARNTYVWVGVLEVASADAGNNERTNKVILSAVASANGEMADLAAGSVRPIMPPRELKNVHLAQFPADLLPDSGRETLGVDDISQGGLGSDSEPANFTQRIGETSRTFTQLILFSPAGEARIKNTASRWIEIGLQPHTGNRNNRAVLQINGLTGQVRTFRS